MVDSLRFRCLCELVATLHATRRYEPALAFAKVTLTSFELLKGNPDSESLKVSFLKVVSDLATKLGHDSKPYDKQLAEMR